jgi:hypothetical protein
MNSKEGNQQSAISNQQAVGNRSAKQQSHNRHMQTKRGVLPCQDEFHQEEYQQLDDWCPLLLSVYNDLLHLTLPMDGLSSLSIINSL